MHNCIKPRYATVELPYEGTVSSKSRSRRSTIKRMYLMSTDWEHPNILYTALLSKLSSIRNVDLEGCGASMPYSIVGKHTDFSRWTLTSSMPLSSGLLIILVPSKELSETWKVLARAPVCRSSGGISQNKWNSTPHCRNVCHASYVHAFVIETGVLKDLKLRCSEWIPNDHDLEFSGGISTGFQGISTKLAKTIRFSRSELKIHLWPRNVIFLASFV